MDEKIWPGPTLEMLESKEFNAVWKEKEGE